MLSGLETITMLQSITRLNEHELVGMAVLHNELMAMEALAQAASLHVRQLINFERHSFLLSIKSMELPREISGRYKIHAKLTARSQHAFSYAVTAGEISAELVIATSSDFPDNRDHYRELIRCLKNA